AADDAGGAVAAKVDAKRTGERGHAGESASFRPNGLVKRYGEGAIADASLVRAVTIAAMALEFRVCTGAPVEDNELLRIFHWYGSQEHGVDEAEDRGVGADAEGEGEHGDGGEAGGLAKHAQSVTQVLNEILNPIYVACVTILFFGLLDTTHIDSRSSVRFFLL